MAVLRLIDALPDFGMPERVREPLADASPMRDPAPSAPSMPDIGQIVRTEVAMAEEAVTMRLSVAHEAALLLERQSHAEQIETLRTAFGEDAGAMIAQRLTEAQNATTEHVSAAVARLVGNILTEDLRKRSIASLARSIDEASRDAEALRIDVRGPQALFMALATAAGDRARNLHHIETDDFDLTVTIDGTIFETRISEWAAVLTEVLA